MVKTCKIGEDTRILLNNAKARYLLLNPEARIASDDLVIAAALNEYMEGENGRGN